eukprot:6970876-Pyramimonas_sp.AAC.1
MLGVDVDADVGVLLVSPPTGVVGVAVGELVSKAVGAAVVVGSARLGFCVGETVGLDVGRGAVGEPLGLTVGLAVGTLGKAAVGPSVSSCRARPADLLEKLPP